MKILIADVYHKYIYIFVHQDTFAINSNCTWPYIRIEKDLENLKKRKRNVVVKDFRECIYIIAISENICTFYLIPFFILIRRKLLVVTNCLYTHLHGNNIFSLSLLSSPF